VSNCIRTETLTIFEKIKIKLKKLSYTTIFSAAKENGKYLLLNIKKVTSECGNEV